VSVLWNPRTQATENHGGAEYSTKSDQIMNCQLRNRQKDCQNARIRFIENYHSWFLYNLIINIKISFKVANFYTRTAVFCYKNPNYFVFEMSTGLKIKRGNSNLKLKAFSHLFIAN